jgi:hypothetical protein
MWSRIACPGRRAGFYLPGKGQVLAGRMILCCLTSRGLHGRYCIGLARPSGTSLSQGSALVWNCLVDAAIVDEHRIDWSCMCYCRWALHAICALPRPANFVWVPFCAPSCTRWHRRVQRATPRIRFTPQGRPPAPHHGCAPRQRKRMLVDWAACRAPILARSWLHAVCGGLRVPPCLGPVLRCCSCCAGAAASWPPHAAPRRDP